MVERRVALVLALLVVPVGCIAACSSDDTPATAAADAGKEGSTTDADATAANGAVSGTVTYSGSATGPAIYVAMFKSFPPLGPPDASLMVKPATFPASYTVSDVEPGMYFLTMYLSTNSDHPQGPLPGDPQAMPQQVMVTAGQTVNVDVTLMDGAPPQDGGSDAADAADAADGGG